MNKGVVANMKECLWCGDEILKKDWDYQFCNSCLDNLEELESITDNINLTEAAESLLKEDNS